MSSRLINMTGQVFGRLTVTGQNGRNRHGQTVWLCRCKCGKEKTNSRSNLIRGRVRSCGCLKRDLAHAKSKGTKKSREYRIWAGIITRCLNPRSSSFPNYGGRGISVCDRWRKFENFIADMGPCPAGFSVERKNNNLGYCPENCTWADMIAQCNNRRTNNIISFNGESLTLAQWSRKIGINSATLKNRLVIWPVEKSLTEPVRQRS